MKMILLAGAAVIIASGAALAQGMSTNSGTNAGTGASTSPMGNAGAAPIPQTHTGAPGTVVMQPGPTANPPMNTPPLNKGSEAGQTNSGGGSGTGGTTGAGRSGG